MISENSISKIRANFSIEMNSLTKGIVLYLSLLYSSKLRLRWKSGITSGIVLNVKRMKTSQNTSLDSRRYIKE